MAEFVFLAPVVVAVVLDALLVPEVLAFLVLVVPEAEAVLALVVAGFAGCWFTGAVLVAAFAEASAGALPAVPAEAGVPVVFWVFVTFVFAVAGVLVLAPELEAVAELAAVLVAVPGVLVFAAGAVLAVAVVFAAGFAVTALLEVIVVLDAVGVALAGLVTGTLPTLVVGDEAAALCPPLLAAEVPPSPLVAKV